MTDEQVLDAWHAAKMAQRYAVTEDPSVSMAMKLKADVAAIRRFGVGGHVEAYRRRFRMIWLEVAPSAPRIDITLPQIGQRSCAWGLRRIDKVRVGMRAFWKLCRVFGRVWVFSQRRSATAIVASKPDNTYFVAKPCSLVVAMMSATYVHGLS